ncbi:MAG: hypothetical protein DRN96_01905 [Thermoproteota archaeon]|nr:MAG: hypothetical protein DRN99_07485 [Candidatus Korarchaeota archaeon]RLG52690.1 MAG: hypothetical protein DRN96_01905 [Candidatus Korarchaeota archaeon]
MLFLHLTSQDKLPISSERDVIDRCMRVLLSVGEAFGASRLIPIESAHVSGNAYTIV